MYYLPCYACSWFRRIHFYGIITIFAASFPAMTLYVLTFFGFNYPGTCMGVTGFNARFCCRRGAVGYVLFSSQARGYLLLVSLSSVDPGCCIRYTMRMGCALVIAFGCALCASFFLAWSEREVSGLGSGLGNWKLTAR